MDETSNNMVYRAFSASDFDAAAELIRVTWCTELGEAAGPVAGRLELATYLAQTTWGRVAEKDGQLMGIVLVAVHGDEIAGRELWQAELDRIGRLLEADPEMAAAVQVEMAGVAEEDELAAEYAATGADEAHAAFKLLIVSPKARGLGVGGRLFSAAVEHARERGAAGFHLLTDDSCDVSFYDHQGLTQAMRRRSKVEWPSSAGAAAGAQAPDFNVYVYAQRF